MLTQLELGAEIPNELYQTIVDIYVYFLHYGENKTIEPGDRGGAGWGGIVCECFAKP